jgi:hypothetical protein
MVVFENDNYVVNAGEFPNEMKLTAAGLEFRAGYYVLNKATGIMEYASLQLPDVIGTAVQLDIMLKKKPWESGEDPFAQMLMGAAVLPDGSPVH